MHVELMTACILFLPSLLPLLRSLCDSQCLMSEQNNQVINKMITFWCSAKRALETWKIAKMSTVQMKKKLLGVKFSQLTALKRRLIMCIMLNRMLSS